MYLGQRRLTDPINVMLFDTAGEAIEQVDTSGRGTAMVLEGQPMVIDGSDADLLAAAGVESAYLHGYQPRPRIPTISEN
jgi:hypothetical protein